MNETLALSPFRIPDAAARAGALVQRRAVNALDCRPPLRIRVRKPAQYILAQICIQLLALLGERRPANTSVVGANLDALTVVVGGGSGTFLVGASGSYTTNDVLTITGSSLDLRSSALGISAIA